MGIMRTLKRDVGSQFAVSRNLKEPAMLRVRRAFWAVVYLIKAFKIGAKSIRHEALGSQVIYKGMKCFVSNWATSTAPTLSGDGFYERNCDRKEIKNVINARELYHRFEVGLNHYMSSWYGIDINRRLYPSTQPVKESSDNE